MVAGRVLGGCIGRWKACPVAGRTLGLQPKTLQDYLGPLLLCRRDGKIWVRNSGLFALDKTEKLAGQVRAEQWQCFHESSCIAEGQMHQLPLL